MTNKIYGRILTLGLAAAALLTLGFFSPADAEAKEPVSMIFDTDMGNDIDDALALAMIHSMANRGECKLLAVTITKDNFNAVPYIQMVNAYYGRPDIPIGLVQNGIKAESGPYLQKVFELKDACGFPLFKYPVDVEINPAVPLLRKTLSEAEDHSVVIVQVGFSTNLAQLLETQGDEYSPLTGKELAAQKVKFVGAMFGAYTEELKKHQEFNVVCDIPSAQKFIQNWPTEIHFSGFEIGLAVPFVGQFFENANYTFPNPIRESFHLYVGEANEQSTWDLTSVLEAVRPNEYFDLSERGRVTVRDDGSSFFMPDPNGNHFVFKPLSETQKARVQEALRHLATEPPQKSR